MSISFSSQCSIYRGSSFVLVVFLFLCVCVCVWVCERKEIRWDWEAPAHHENHHRRWKYLLINRYFHTAIYCQIYLVWVPLFIFFSLFLSLNANRIGTIQQKVKTQSNWTLRRFDHDIKERLIYWVLYIVCKFKNDTPFIMSDTKVNKRWITSYCNFKGLW